MGLTRKVGDAIERNPTNVAFMENNEIIFNTIGNFVAQVWNC